MLDEYGPLAAVVIALLIGTLLGWYSGNGTMEKIAVKTGHAEYVLVNGGPDTKFQWKEKP